MRAAPLQLIERVPVVVKDLDLASQLAVTPDGYRFGHTDGGSVVDRCVVADDQTGCPGKFEADDPSLVVADGDVITKVNFAVTENKRDVAIPPDIPPHRGTAIFHNLADILIFQPTPAILPYRPLGQKQHAEQPR